MIPVIVLYEVYKVLKREVGEEKSLLAADLMKNSSILPFNDTLALAAADISLKESLVMADAIIVTAAQANGCNIITSDADLKDQPHMADIPQKQIVLLKAFFNGFNG